MRPLLVALTLLSVALPARADNALERFATFCRRGLVGQLDPRIPQPGQVLGEFEPYSWADRTFRDANGSYFLIDKSARELTREWARAAVSAIGSAPIAAKDKVTAYEKLVAELQWRLDQMQRAVDEQGPGSHLTRWTCRKIEVGGGITIFVGDIGKIVEIHPNGDVIRIDMLPTSGENVMSPNWKPPYNPDGTRDNSRFMLSTLKKAG